MNLEFYMPAREKMREELYSGAFRYGITLNDDSLSLFEKYYDLLLEWNDRMNLVSNRDMTRFVPYHLLDSLKVASCFDMHKVNRMLDFGSGAGLPGIPLSLAFPHIETYLVDSRKKKCIFLENIIGALSINARVLRSRIEHLPDLYNDYFDLVITRATVELETFFRYAHRLIHSGGSLIAIKSNNIHDEFRRLQTISDSRVFNIKLTAPKDVSAVRQGNIAVMTRY